MITDPHYFRDRNGQLKPINEIDKTMDSISETFFSSTDQKWWCVKHGSMSGWLDSGYSPLRNEWRWGSTREQAQLKLWNDFAGHHTNNPKHFGGKDIMGRAGL
tara:strand:- start:1649 stop:1957 length:309 start_codon:yes stop_codon:yes gene_type:complete